MTNAPALITVGLVIKETARLLYFARPAVIFTESAPIPIQSVSPSVVPSWRPCFPVGMRLMFKERIANIGQLEDEFLFRNFNIFGGLLGLCEPAYCA